MVFFTCDACGESLKKAQVEKHLLKCRGCRVLSCIDCGKDFRGDDYKNHNKCISEDQKYGGRDFQAKTNKGDVKQQQWIQRIQEAMERPGIQPRLQQVLRQVSAYDNVPRKRAKFQNWMKNSLKIHSPDLQEQVWEIFSTAADSHSNQTNHQTADEHKPNTSVLNNGSETNEEKTEEQKNKKNKRKTSEEQNGQNTCEKQSRKKRKREEREQNGQNADEKMKKRKEEAFDESLNLEGEEPENQQSESNTTGKFNWKGTIKAVLRDAPDDGLAVKKLRKKVLAAYYSFSGDGNYRSEEELLSLFNRKINKNPKFRILKDKVRLVK
ncbi:cell growth-regulating nucleolar protein [Ctenopharyngodon idella]|uniref:cell growth-regulating nucleolar protein n=1 Tax=Ctenopharyngodon idella TaxID=7959 RepID=UPI00223154E8|nr:cell growth-regulating nucleolar protein [Ctenopharyngodon idella]XP_051715890.1 cell growth-regulating nucleolar protein [Ctenopharyngodon idella]